MTYIIILLYYTTANGVTVHDYNYYCTAAGNVIEREAHDRADINLPGSQLQLLQDATNIVPGKL